MAEQADFRAAGSDLIGSRFSSPPTGKGSDDLGKKRLSGVTACITSTAIILLLSSSIAAQTIHKVRSGDTLWSLARKHHTTPKAIAKANGISENAVLAVGKTLVIPGSNIAAGRAGTDRQYNRASYIRHATNRLVQTNSSTAILRERPSSSSRKIKILAEGTILKLLYCHGNWAKVAMADGACGFVYRALLAHKAGSSSDNVAASSTDDQKDDPSNITSKLVQTALACRGIRYSRGGTSRGGFDCSGFTRYVFAKYGVSLPHSSAAQARMGTPVSRDELRPGDLVFFQTNRRGISHVGIYIGNNRFVHAATHGRGVTVDSLSSAYYASRYRGARRVK